MTGVVSSGYVLHIHATSEFIRQVYYAVYIDLDPCVTWSSILTLEFGLLQTGHSLDFRRPVVVGTNISKIKQIKMCKSVI